MLCASVVVALLGEQLSQLHEGAGFTLLVLELGAQLEVAFNKHLELVLVDRGVDMASSDLAKVSNGD